MDQIENKGNNLAILCSLCSSDRKRNELCPIAIENNMNPGRVPHDISELNVVERRFIALIHVFIMLFCLARKHSIGRKRYGN